MKKETKDLLRKKLGEEFKIYFILAILLPIAVLLGLYSYILNSESFESETYYQERDKMQQQKAELERLFSELEKPTEEELEQQHEELKKAFSNYDPPTEEELAEQKEQLNQMFNKLNQ